MPKAASSGANLGFEAKLFLTADKLRGSMDASEYKHVALGLIFLKYISDAFTSIYERLKADELASKGVGAHVLAELSGHRNIATTQRYIDVNDYMLRNAVELV
jgi:type I restriction enzyme M protein